MNKVYLAPGHGRRPNGLLDPGAVGGGTNEQEAGDRIARQVESFLLGEFEDVEVQRQARGGPNFVGTRDEVNASGADVALELHHDWIRAPRGGFGFHQGGERERIADALTDAYREVGLPTRAHMRTLPGTTSEPGLYRGTPATTILWELDRIGTTTEDHARAVAYGIADYLGLKEKAVRPPASRSYVTVGDEGEAVREWQELLMEKGFALPRFGADGVFGEETRTATLDAYEALGLTASDPSAPRVGSRSFSALRDYQPRRKEWRGKSVRAKVDLRFYPAPRWDRPAGTMKAGHHFPRIEGKVAVGSGHQYRVRNSRGDGPFYVTASPRFVDLV